MSNRPPVRNPSKPFAFDGDYRDNHQECGGPRGELVSFFETEPVQPQGRSTEWTASPVSEEDLKEGMDDFAKSEEPSSEDLKELIASMPHNIAKRIAEDLGDSSNA